VGRNYGLALLFITPMALLMKQLGAARPTGRLLLGRGIETVFGAIVAIGPCCSPSTGALTARPDHRPCRLIRARS